MHKGVFNVSHTVFYVAGVVLLVVGFLIGVAGSINIMNYPLVAIGFAISWLGIIIAFISGYLGNKFIPEGYGEKKK